MTKQKLDEFDEKAKKFLEDGNMQRVRNILREYALCEAYDLNMELENPERMLRMAGIDVSNIDDFTEFRVAKTLITEQIKKEKKKRGVFGSFR
ncbi:MAG: hypothetical protein ABEJ99_01690 [Candidatus Nanohaloarchaea archaeon]